MAAPHAAPSTEFRPRRPDELLLHRVVREHLLTFLAREAERGVSLPRFVDRELRKFVACGVPALGFVRVRCTACGYDRAVPFSCKGRGFCPSCGGRRMAETAARLVARVLPRVPIRQWVLSLPRPLRYRLAYDAALCSAVLGVFLRAVFGWLRRRAQRAGVSGGKPGAVTQIQRFGSAINANLHLHSLVLDGVYDDRARFHALPPPTQRDVEKICATIARRVRRLLARRGLADESAADALAEQEPLLSGVCAASIQGLVATGDRAGGAVQRVGDQVEEDEPSPRPSRLCAQVAGFNLEAAVVVPARDRRRLETLCKYISRPPIAADRLSELSDGRLSYELKKRWSDGTTHVLFRPTELIEKLVALVPAPQKNLLRYHGVLAARARLRPQVVAAARPDPIVLEEAPAPGPVTPPRPGRYMSWADLLKMVFQFDVLCCPGAAVA
jgi:putative transposase/transposase-like zinc-binding protein